MLERFRSSEAAKDQKLMPGHWHYTMHYTMNEKDCSEIETSYENVEAAVRKTEHNETVFIMGDFNAKVGSMKSPGTGFHGLRNRNESGDRSIEW